MPGDGWFRRKSKLPPKKDQAPAVEVPDGVATKCVRCGQILFTREFEKALKVCPHCSFHHKLTAAERVAFTADEGTWCEFAAGLRSQDPLSFPDYAAKLEKARRPLIASTA